MSRFPYLFGFVVLASCATSTSDDGVADDAALSESSLSRSVPVGTELVTITTVNLRRGPGPQHPVVRTLRRATTVVTVNRTTPEGKFFNVRAGTDEGWVHGAFVVRNSSGAERDSGENGPVGPTREPAPEGCVTRRLKFSADELPALPAAGSAFVWGGNGTDGEAFLDPPYSTDFRARARAAHDRQLEVFAYLEGPCGDTDGEDDGERARCAEIHNSYNAEFAPGTPDTPEARWKPFTMKQLTTSGQNGVDYCEIDNLDNNVTIPLNPLLREIKRLFDVGKIHCRLVLKNVSASTIDSIRSDVAPAPQDAKFIAPFHIFEADDTGEKAALDAAMRRLKGPGAVTIISTDTNHYGGAFTPDEFLTCR
jgi:hypothetical protein